MNSWRPHGFDSGADSNLALLARMDARLPLGRDGAGETIGARFTAQVATCRPVPAPFVAEATTFVTVSPRGLGRVDGAVYSVPCRWAGLDLVVRVGATPGTWVKPGDLLVETTDPELLT